MEGFEIKRKYRLMREKANEKALKENYLDESIVELGEALEIELGEDIEYLDPDVLEVLEIVTEDKENLEEFISTAAIIGTTLAGAAATAARTKVAAKVAKVRKGVKIAAVVAATAAIALITKKILDLRKKKAATKDKMAKARLAKQIKAEQAKKAKLQAKKAAAKAK